MEDKIYIKAFAVIDTNVIISSMLGTKPSSTKEIMSMIKNGNLIPLYDQRMIDEYSEVIGRFFEDDIVEEKISEIIENGYMVMDIKETISDFADKDDIPFFEVKESTKELDPYLITGNTKDFPEDKAVTPAFVIKVMRYLNRFVINDKEKFLKDFDTILKDLDPTKYKHCCGEELLKGRESEIDR